MKKLLSLLALAAFPLAVSSCYPTNNEKAIKNATAQGPTGEPHIGLIPTMKKLPE
jgi:hypothetical protein